MGTVYVGSVWLGQMFDLQQTGRSSFAFLMLQENKRCSSQTSHSTWGIYRREDEFNWKSSMGVSADCPFKRKFPAPHTLHYS